MSGLLLMRFWKVCGLKLGSKWVTLTEAVCKDRINGLILTRPWKSPRKSEKVCAIIEPIYWINECEIEFYSYFKKIWPPFHRYKKSIIPSQSLVYCFYKCVMIPRFQDFVPFMIFCHFLTVFLEGYRLHSIKVTHWESIILHFCIENDCGVIRAICKNFYHHRTLWCTDTSVDWVVGVSWIYRYMIALQSRDPPDRFWFCC